MNNLTSLRNAKVIFKTRSQIIFENEYSGEVWVVKTHGKSFKFTRKSSHTLNKFKLPTNLEKSEFLTKEEIRMILFKSINLTRSINGEKVTN